MKIFHSKAVFREKGFTLVELTLVITVMAILVTGAFVVYTHFLKKARRVEAKKVLSDLSKQEEAYFVEHDAYTDDLNKLGLLTLGSTKFYTYTVTVPDPNTSDPDSFLATASGNIDNDPALDEWTIDKNRTLRHTKED